MITSIIPNLVINIILLSICLAPIGVILIWKRHSYLSDSISHTSLISAIIVSTLDISILISLIISAILTITIILALKNWYENHLATILVTNFLVAAALFIDDLFPNYFNLNTILFGDIFLLDENSIYIQIVIIICEVLLLLKYHRQIILYCINPDIATAIGAKAETISYCTLIFLTMAISVALKVSGALMTTALIITPAAIAKIFSTTPLRMIIISIIISIFTNLLGFYAAIIIDSHISSTISLIYFCVLIVSLIYKNIHRRL